MIYCDLASLYRMFVVLRRVCLEFFNEGGEERISYPPSLGKGSVGVWVRLHKPKREEMYENRFILFFVVFLHWSSLYIFLLFFYNSSNPGLFDLIMPRLLLHTILMTRILDNNFINHLRSASDERVVSEVEDFFAAFEQFRFQI